MSTPELGESGFDLSGYSLGDQEFIEKVQDRLYERPLADKIRGAVPKILLLVSSLGTLALGHNLGNTEIFAVGICLSSLWQTNNWISNWRTFLTIGS